MAGVAVAEQQKIIVEIVGPGFDASDILRGDIHAHERWELGLTSALLGRGSGSTDRAVRIHLSTSEDYEKSVQERLAKIGDRINNPAFPDVVLKTKGVNVTQLRETGADFLRRTHQMALLKNAKAYTPIPEKYLLSFARYAQNLLSGLAAYGIHLGPTSFAASVLPKRGLIFWDFFPASKREAIPYTQRSKLSLVQAIPRKS